MKRFEFSLEAVLQQRKWAEEQRQRELGVHLAEMARLEGELRRLDGSVREASEELRSGHLTGRIDLSFLAAHRRFLLATQRNAGVVLEEMGQVRVRIERARALLVEASKARKVVEKLRERRLAEWKQGVMKAEQEETDDVNSGRVVYQGLRSRSEALADEVAG